MLIALTGKAGAGKDTAADALVAAYGLRRLAFADPLKRACIHKFDLSEHDVYTQEGKARFIPEFGCTAGEILQREGTEGTKPIWGESHWLKLLDKQYQRLCQPPHPGAVITDCRFDAEAQYIRSTGGFIIRIIRPDHTLGGRNPNHASEQGISDQYVDATVINDATVEDLWRNVWVEATRLAGSKT